MGKNSSPLGPVGYEQLERYAKDLRAIYKSEQEKSREIESWLRQVGKYAEDLNKNFSDLKTAYQNLQEAYLDTINRLVLAAEYKDEDTGDHIVRMSRYCSLIAEKLEWSDADVQNILYASPMHDVGKIGIPDSILLKPGKLTDEEFEIIKTHTTIGAKILANSRSDILKLAQQIAVSHHEKWNGRGYPQGLSRQSIPVAGRIVAIADVFDALTSKRPYKEPFPVEKAIEIIKEGSGEHFDPDIVEVFLENIDEVLKIKTDAGS